MFELVDIKPLCRKVRFLRSLSACLLLWFGFFHSQLLLELSGEAFQVGVRNFVEGIREALGESSQLILAFRLQLVHSFSQMLFVGTILFGEFGGKVGQGSFGSLKTVPNGGLQWFHTLAVASRADGFAQGVGLSDVLTRFPEFFLERELKQPGLGQGCGALVHGSFDLQKEKEFPENSFDWVEHCGAEATKGAAT